jgi:hypothetical protein
MGLEAAMGPANVTDSLQNGFGSFDNRNWALGRPDHRRVRKTSYMEHGLARLKGRRAPLYRGGGEHLRLPGKPDTIYVYIRKNGCSAFKKWLLAEVGDTRNLSTEDPSIGVLSKRLQVTSDDQLSNARCVLVLRDPIARLCSLFRNKLIQRRGADDILANIEELTGLSTDALTFRRLVEQYIGGHLHCRSGLGPKIDPHCTTQHDHLWPILYDRVIMLEDLPKAAVALFGKDIAAEYFSVPANASSTSLVQSNASDLSAGELRNIYSVSNALPSDDSLLDDKLRNAIRDLYSLDYKLIASIWPESSPDVLGTIGMRSTKVRPHPLSQ